MIVFLILLIFFSAFLSGSETALFSLPTLTIRSYSQSKKKKHQIISHLMQHPRDVLVTILILNVLSNILIQNTVSSIFDHYESLLLKIIVPLVLTLVLGEVLPKSLALPNCIQISSWAAPTIFLFSRALKWVRQPLTRFTSFLSRSFFLFLKEEKEISVEELRHVLKTSKEKGILTEAESGLIGGALDLQNSQVKDHMRPREEVLFYDVQKPLSELFDLFVKQELTRVPVGDGSLENIKGILSSHEFFFQKDRIKAGKSLLSFLQKPYFLPESTRAWSALKTLRQKVVSLALVVDEYGSISGLITQEDLIEEVIGEVIDVRDTGSLYTLSNEDVMIASAKLELSEFEEIFDVHLKTDQHVVTLGGWLIEKMEKIPQAGEKYATDQFLFHILAADPNRIRKIYVRRMKK